MQPDSCTVPGDFRATIVRILAYLGGLAILAVAAASVFRAPAPVAAVEPAPQPEWVSVERPRPAFELQMPELAADTAGYAILRRPADGARKDLLSFGEPGAAGPYVVVEIYRPGAQSERFIDAPSEIAARIIAFTVTDDVKPAGQIDGKFGAVPLVDFAIGVQRTFGGKQRRCLGFATAFDAPVMQIAGWYCSAGEEAVDRATLACALDRLTILSAGGDATLAGLFARAELKRTFCGRRDPILAATPEREVAVPIPRSIRFTRSDKLRGRTMQH
ncbi:MAG TPA: hypothetical protein VEF90_09435 [Xanthobacteraceae bacterium]|nr:hypothetical protein [Xanthobacteraceae bacterium]